MLALLASKRQEILAQRRKIKIPGDLELLRENLNTSFKWHKLAGKNLTEGVLSEGY
jgi:hypothetical protein